MTIRSSVQLVLVGLTLCVCAQNLAQNTTGSQSANQSANSMGAHIKFDDAVTQFSNGYQSLAPAALDLSYAVNFERLESPSTLLKQQAFFSTQLERISRFQESDLDACQRIERSIIEIESRLGLERAKLALKNDSAVAITDSGIYHQPNGRLWYAYFLARWNGAWLEFDHLYKFGEHELAKAVAAYDEIQSELGYADDDAGLARHLGNSQRFEDDKSTLAWFETQQDIVWDNLSRIFTVSDAIKKAVIKSSDRGQSFPVPGYYDPPSETFYFNQFKDYYDGRQSDWLLLHEASPGHHFQIATAQLNSRCPQRLPNLSYSAYSEGWAAYAETLGEQLGVYQTLEARLAAIEWDMVRSVRVVLDVAINGYGWSDEQALEYWLEHVRGQRDVAEREIARMRRWPAQVVTYKYGADYFKRLRDKVVKPTDNEETRIALIRRYHDTVVSFRSMPLTTFEGVLPLLLNK